MDPQLHYGIVDPDYARVYTQTRIIAWQYGYACLMHGSFTRDLDLLLTPWEERATENHEQLLRLIADACNLHLYVERGKLRGTNKPHGRKAYTLHFPGVADRRWVDISIAPCVSKGSAAGNAEYDSWVTRGVDLPDGGRHQ